MGCIEINTAQQLNAVSYELNGGGIVADANTTTYTAETARAQRGPTTTPTGRAYAAPTPPNSTATTTPSPTSPSPVAAKLGCSAPWTRGAILDVEMIEARVSSTTGFYRHSNAVDFSEITASYVRGSSVTVTGLIGAVAGGLTGENAGTIRAAYATASVDADGDNRGRVDLPPDPEKPYGPANHTETLHQHAVRNGGKLPNPRC